MYIFLDIQIYASKFNIQEKLGIYTCNVLNICEMENNFNILTINQNGIHVNQLPYYLDGFLFSIKFTYEKFNQYWYSENFNLGTIKICIFRIS